MHSSSVSSLDNPMVLDECSKDIDFLMTIISQHPCRALERCSDWATARRLYLLMQKYQLDPLQPWFSMMAGYYAWSAPTEALCLACNNPCFDEKSGLLCDNLRDRIYERKGSLRLQIFR